MPVYLPAPLPLLCYLFWKGFSGRLRRSGRRWQRRLEALIRMTAATNLRQMLVMHSRKHQTRLCWQRGHCLPGLLLCASTWWGSCDKTPRLPRRCLCNMGAQCVEAEGTAEQAVVMQGMTQGKPTVACCDNDGRAAVKCRNSAALPDDGTNCG